MGSYEQKSPSSVLSPWLLDINLSSSSLTATNKEGIDNPPCMNGSTLQPPSASLKGVPSSSTSNLSWKGSSATRVSKRRRKSRAKPKAPITQLSANKFNFKDVVHQFTGKQNNTPASLTANSCKALDAHAAPSQINAVLRHGAAELAQSCRLLYTMSSYFLQHRSLTQIQKQLPNRNHLAFLEGLINEPGQAPTSIASEGSSNEPQAPTCIASEILQGRETLETETKTADLGLANMLDGEHHNNAQELERFLLKGNGHLDNFFSLAHLLLKQIALQSGLLALTYN